jgi:hypothetical protein
MFLVKRKTIQAGFACVARRTRFGGKKVRQFPTATASLKTYGRLKRRGFCIASA